MTMETREYETVASELCELPSCPFYYQDDPVVASVEWVVEWIFALFVRFFLRQLRCKDAETPAEHRHHLYITLEDDSDKNAPFLSYKRYYASIKDS